MEGRMRKSKFAVLMLLICTLLAGCIRPTSPDGGETSQNEDMRETVVGYYTSVQYVYQSDVNEALLTTDMDEQYLLLMNKIHTLGADHAPESITMLTCPTLYDKSVELETGVAKALYEMFDEMRAAGVTDIMVTSGYRTYDYQTMLFNNYLQYEQSTLSADAYACLGADYIQETYLENGKSGLNPADALRVVKSYSAEPGKSEHQTGLCVDFITSEMNGSLTVAFEDTEAFAWLSKNAYKFGFILRYPKEKEEVTGYTYEPWHYRFVGREAATDIHYGGLTLEEYLALMK